MNDELYRISYPWVAYRKAIYLAASQSDKA